MAELRGELHLALEAGQALRPRLVRPQQLDRGRAAQHGVLGAVDHAHAALAEPFLERVLAEVARLAHLAAQAVDDTGSDGGGGDGQDHPGRPVDGAGDGHGRGAPRFVPPHTGGHGQRGQEADDQGPQRRARHEHGPPDQDMRQDEQHRPFQPRNRPWPEQEGQGNGSGGHDGEGGVDEGQRVARKPPLAAPEPHREIEDVDDDLGRDRAALRRRRRGHGCPEGQGEPGEKEGRDGEYERHLAQEGEAVLQEGTAFFRVQVHDAGPAGRAANGVQGGDGHGLSS